MTDSSVTHPSEFHNFLPEMFTVAAGAYLAEPPTHTVGAPMVETYWPVQFQNGTTTIPLTGSGTDFLPGAGACEWSLAGGTVRFTMVITLNASPGSDPLSGSSGNEVRIRPYVSGVANEPARYRKNLPIPDANFPMPVFDAFAYDKSDVVAGPFGAGSTGTTSLKAHMLMDGTLALVTTINGAYNPFGVAGQFTHGAWSFLGVDWTTADRLVRILIQGTYNADIGRAL